MRNIYSAPDMTAHPGRIPPKADSPRILAPLMEGPQRVKYMCLVLLWVVLAAWFWRWWLQPEHIIGMGRYILVTLCILWLFFLQAYFIVLFLNGRKVVASFDDLGQPRIAMVVTKTPSEPFAMVKTTLEAMLAQDVPHDTWLADEDPQPDTIDWCRTHGVRISSRKGRDAYHRTEWPRRTRCKEGNLAFFYDNWGYDDYDFVSQLDADHVPQPSYLRELMKPFADPSIGYVSAPSICNANAVQSWAARARLYIEAMFHGALQAGYSGGWAPMCIGSHYAVRTRALRQIGGLGPELAEDHSTSLIMNANGWRGVHAMNAIAHGAGPGTLADMATQEFQWSRSLVTLLLQYTPRYLAGLPAHLKFQFVFSQMWYPIAALFLLAIYTMPVVALTFDVRYADVTYPGFIGHAVPATLALILLVWVARRDGFFRPHDAKILSWEKILFAAAQWPWMFWGCAVAVWDRLTGRFVDFRITPKGDAVEARLPLRFLVPYAAIALFCMWPILTVDNVTNAAGFYILSLLNAALNVALVVVIVWHHLKNAGIGALTQPLVLGAQIALCFGLVGLGMMALWMRGPESLYALMLGLDAMHVVETQHIVSGAGRAPPGEVKYVFKLGWD